MHSTWMPARVLPRDSAVRLHLNIQVHNDQGPGPHVMQILACISYTIFLLAVCHGHAYVCFIMLVPLYRFIGRGFGAYGKSGTLQSLKQRQQ